MLSRLLALLISLPLLLTAPVFATDYDVVNEDIWPSQNDVAQTAGNGKKLLENQWQEAIVSITETNFVSSGCALPASSGNLNISVPACQALINGRFVDIPASTTITASASATNHVYLKFVRDGASLATGAKFEVNTTGTAPADSVKIGTLVASGSAITSTNQDGMPRGFTRPTKGPVAVGAGSTRSHEGTVTIASNQNLSGIHFYTDFTLNSGVTITVPAGKRRLFIVASGTIRINGTITAAGAGAAGSVAAIGRHGTDQPGGGGGPAGFAGGDAVLGPYTIQSGGAAGSPGAAGAQITGSDSAVMFAYTMALGGAAGGGSAGFSGGNGGGSIVLIAPTIVLGGTATLVTSGSQGGGDGSGSAPGGGGGAGNINVLTQSYTDNGCTFTQTGGASGPTSGFGGGAGAAGVKQISLY